MKIHRDAIGYLEKASNTSWADCLTATATVNGEWADSAQQVYMGKRYVADDSTNKWRFFQTFLRFDLSDIPDNDEIDSAKLRMHLKDTDLPDTDFTMNCRVLTSSYGTLDATDWSGIGGPTVRETEATSTVATDVNGYSYLEVTLNSDQLALLPTDDTIDFVLMPLDLTTEPTDKEYVQLYSGASSTFGIWLDLTINGRREQIMSALITQLDTIDEYSGYNTTPTVSRQYRVLQDLERGKSRIAPVRQTERRSQGTGYELCPWEITFGLQIYKETQTEMDTALNEIIDDFTRCIEADACSGNDRLDLSFVHKLYVSNIETAAHDVIDDNRAEATITVAVEYARLINEG